MEELKEKMPRFSAYTGTSFAESIVNSFRGRRTTRKKADNARVEPVNGSANKGLSSVPEDRPAAERSAVARSKTQLLAREIARNGDKEEGDADMPFRRRKRLTEAGGETCASGKHSW